MASRFHAGVLMGWVRERGEEKAPRDEAYILTNCQSEISPRDGDRPAGRLGADFLAGGEGWRGTRADPLTKPQILLTRAVQILMPKYQPGGELGCAVGSTNPSVR